MEVTRHVSTQEVLVHDKPDDCWLVIEDDVWDMTSFATEHPGGSSIIYKYAGCDATKAYLEVHSSSVARNNLSLDQYKGTLDRSTVTQEWTALQDTDKPNPTGPDETEKPPLHMIINSYDFEEAAQKWAPPKAYAFYSTADTDCWTRDSNQAMLKRIWFRPRVMKNVAQVDTSSTILDMPVNFPLFICPTGLAKLINPEAEKALARAAKSSGILECLSTVMSHPLTEIVQQAPNYPFLLQLYVNKDRSKSAEMLRSAKSQGIKAIFLTVDAAGRGKRESDERLKVDEVIVNPITGERAQTDNRGGGLTRVMGSYIDQSMTWDIIPWIRSHTDLPLVLKGVTCAADAKIAMDYQVDGILLSNHGGRNLDYAPPSILLLLELHKCCPEIFDRMEIYVDGGFRRGGDILKALCLGAKAVGIGRTFLYSLQYGSEGAEHLVDILKTEMESAMKLIGITDLSQVHPGLVNTLDIDHLVPSGEEHPYARYRPKARSEPNSKKKKGGAKL